MTRVTALLVMLAASACTRGTSRDAATSAPRPLIMNALEHVDRKAREPMLAEHPAGTLFVSGYGEPTPMLWKSGDRGATWIRVDVGRTEDGAVGNSDVDLAVARDGTLYFVAMVFDAKAGEGRRISVGVSHDAGTRWTWTRLSEQRYDDRPWVDVADDGTAHVIWNDGSGVNHAVSRDGGTTWVRRAKISLRGGSSHLAVGPGSRVAVRVTPLSASGSKMDPGVDLIMISSDGGATWQEHPAPGTRDWKRLAEMGANDTPRWVEPVAWDAHGALYSVWTDRNGVWLARSADEARTWRISRVASTAGFFPYLVASRSGELAVTWFSGSLSPSADRFVSMEGHIARLDARDGAADPRVVETGTFRLGAWDPGTKPPDPPAPDPAGEYIAATFLSDGTLAAVTPIQDAAKNRFGFTFWRTAGPAAK